MKTIDQAGDLNGKKVLMRADFDVPLDTQGNIAEEYRIVAQRECVRQLLDRGARVLMIAHSGSAPSFEPLVPHLERILGVQMRFCRDFADVQAYWSGAEAVALFENLRSDPGEEANDAAYARRLVEGCDLFVNNAFAVCHRAHASVVRIPGLVSSYAGPLIVKEVAQLARAISAPAKGKIVYMGGAKASTKVPVIRALLESAERIAIGGVLANDIFRVLGRDIGSSRVDEHPEELLAGLDVHDVRLVLPVDSVMDDGRIVDIGPESVALFVGLAAGASTIVWNGPLGEFEDPRFSAGTEAVARAIAASGAWTLVGGGDTIAAVARLNLLDRFGVVSTGGGAMLAFLAGEQLPGLQALGYYAS
ncbi:MAG: phosphoglycerate kinase [Candidatus Yanofskybacteria bacterium]|nr:phosphoglycerate kinase [Candidatus Yanofskybacteria bacterium]